LGWLNEFANSFSGRLSVECEMRPVFVVCGRPLFQLSSKILFVFELPSLVELLRIGLVASLDLSVQLRTARRNVFVRNAEIGKMPGELWSERRAVIGLNLQKLMLSLKK
jgi:hypothetical protein